MIKAVSSVPAIALLLVLLLRGLSAPPSDEQNAHAQETSNSADSDTSANSPYLAFAREVYGESVKAAINARAVELFTKAQSSGQAEQWTRQLCQQTAQQVSQLRQQYGTVTGEAKQYGQLLSRTSELAACSLAYHWVVNGGVASDATSVNPQALLETYQEVFGSGG